MTAFYHSLARVGHKLLRNSDGKPYLLELRSSNVFIITAMCFAVLTDTFLYGILIPVFPYELESRLGVSEDRVQDTISVLQAVYAAGLIGVSPIAGWCADRFSYRRGPLLTGLIALAAATLVLCLTSSYAAFVAGRFFQGAAAAVVWSVGLALVVDTVERKDIGEAMGYIMVGFSLGILGGPPLGGLVYDKGGYYAVFYLSFSLILLDIVLRLVLIEKKEAKKYPTVKQGVTEQDEGRESKEPGTIQATNTESAPQEDIPVATGSKVPPIIRMLRYPRFLVALFATCTQGILMTGLETTLPLHVLELFEFSASKSGLLFLALVVPTLVSPLAGMIIDKTGPRWVAVSGFILCTPFYILLRLPHENTSRDIAIMIVMLAFIGFGLSLTTLLAEITYFLESLEEKEPGSFGPRGAYAQGYGMYNFAYSAGALIGPVWGGFLKSAHGWNTMTWTLGLISFITAIPVLFYTGGKIREDVIFKR